MSFTGIVAFENDEGTYDIHYSNNGGDEYMLREILNEYLAGETNKTADDVPRSEAFCDEAVSMAIASEIVGDGVTVSNAEVIDSEPVATNVEKQNIFAKVGTYDAEAFYVVPFRGESTETYVPVTPNPRPLLDIAESTTLRMYRNAERKHPGIFMKHISHDKIDPDVVLSGDDFHPDKIRNLPYWAKQDIEQAHRYIYNKLVYLENVDKEGMKQDIDIPDSNNRKLGVSLALGTSVVHIEQLNEIAVDRNYPAIPIRVTFGPNNKPVYPMQDSKEMQGAMPKAVGSEERMNVYLDYYDEYHDRSNNPEQVVEQMTLDVTKRIVSEYKNSIAAEYLTDEFQDVLN